jgi:hypothetical protein
MVWAGSNAVSSAKTFARSRREFLEAVLMMEPPENRSRHDSRVTRETMASDWGCWQLSIGLWKSGAEA